MNTRFLLNLQFFAKKKGGGGSSTNCNHDSKSKSRGIKKHDGESAKAGDIIVRQLGSRYLPGKNVYLSRDYTLHAECSGKTSYYQKKLKHCKRTFVEIISD